MTLNYSSRKPPERTPPKPVRPEPLAIRYVRLLAAERPEGWQRLEEPVSKSIVSKKCRAFAAVNSVELKTCLDWVDPEDHSAGRRHYLFGRVL